MPTLQLAFEDARLRDARLIALHPMAPWLATPLSKLDLAVALANWEQDHPDVAVSTAIV